MPERPGAGPDFIEALARGLDVVRSFRAGTEYMSLTEVADAAGVPRPTARRILLTLGAMGYVRTEQGRFALTPKVVELGLAYIDSMDLWSVARPHMEELVRRTGESSSMGQLDGSDMVYVARVAVPKIIALSVTVGTRFPAVQTSLGKVMLAALDRPELDRVLSLPSRSTVTPRWQPDRTAIYAALAEVSERGWALTDQELAMGIRSVAVPVIGGTGKVAAALNVTVHAAETSVEVLIDRHLPPLLEAARLIGRDWSHKARLPHLT